MKVFRKVMTAFGFVIVTLAIVGMASCSSKNRSSGSSSSQQPAQTEAGTGQGDTSDKAEESVPSDTKKSKYAVTIDGVTVGTDYGGDPCVFVSYTFTNVSDEKPASFGLSVHPEVYQAGIQCDTAFADTDGGGNYTTKIKAGNTIAVISAYELQDTTSDVEVEVKELMSFDDTVLAKQVFSIA